MRYWVFFRAEAMADVESAQNYFSSFVIKNEMLFGLELQRCIEQIRDFPESHQQVHREVRRALLSRFSYAVYYTVNLNQETIEIVAILDARRDPQSWKKRL